MSDELCSLRELYALGGLDETEKAVFEAHLTKCATCQEEVAHLKQAADHLLYDFDLIDPPPRMRDRILKNVFSDPEQQEVQLQSTQMSDPNVRLRNVRTSKARHSRSGRWVPWASAAAVCVIILGGASLWDYHRPSITPIGTVETQFALQATGDQGSANMIVTKGANGSTMFIHFSRLKPVSGTQVYQVWLIESGSAPQSAGVFTPDENGNAVFASLMPKGTYQTVAVTLEPKAIDQQPLGQMQFKANL